MQQSIYGATAAERQLKEDALLPPAVNLQAGVSTWFDKFGMVKNDTSRIWEAVGCYVGCRKHAQTGVFGPTDDLESQLYVPRVRSIYQQLWN